MNWFRRSMMLWCFLTVGASSGSADIIAEHTGATNPELESWQSAHFVGHTLILGHCCANVLKEPIFDDDDEDAWVIDDTSNGSLSNDGYAMLLSDSDLAAATRYGFRISVRIKTPNVSDVPQGSVEFIFSLDQDRWQMTYGSDDDGDPIVRLVGPQDIYVTLAGAGPGYHTFELVFDPATETADLFIDGIKYVSGYTGGSLDDGSRYIFWGSGQDSDTGEGRYSVVAFEVLLCRGDLDGDDRIGLTDLAQLLSHFGTNENAAYEDGDIDCDEDVDLNDLSTLLVRFGEACE